MTKTVSTLRGVCWCLFLASAVAAGDQGSIDHEPTELWSFRRLPERKHLLASLTTMRAASGRQPIDRYILRSLRDHGLEPGKRAAPHRQLRRLSLMLTGLPPEASIARRFLADPSDQQYAGLVDHYLNSPQFGERWARHWMDVVRFAETWGYEWNHLVRGAWRYRDYLIRAFNQDVPYDQLIREHIAGDLLDNPRLNTALGINEALIGTAFYRFGETGHDDCVLYPDISLDVMDNQIDTLSKTFQALTVSCSRCHDHKLDDIPQRDYYGLLGVMASSRQVIRTLDLSHRQSERKSKLASLKAEIRAELRELWMREAQELSAESIRGLTDLNETAASATVAMEHPLFVWTKMAAQPARKSWQQRWNENHEAMKAEHDRRIAFNRDNYVTFADFSDAASTNALLTNPRWDFEGLGVEDGECFTAHGDFSILPDGPDVVTGLFPAGFFSHGLSQRLNAVVRSPLLPDDRKFVSYQAMGERQSVCRTVIANCTLPYFHTNRFSSPQLAWSTVNLTHIRKSPLLPFRSYLEWATALDDQGYPVLDMPQVAYQRMLDNPRSYFGVTKVFVHDVDQPPLEDLQPQLQLFQSPVSDLDGLTQRYREILRRSIAVWSNGEAVESDVFWINAFIDLKLLSRDLNGSSRLEHLVAEYRGLENQLEPPQRIVGMSDHGEGFDVPLLAGGDATAPLDIVHRGYLAAIGNKMAHVSQGGESALGSGRLRVAELIAHPDNPLTARVMANRIWHYLLGRGLVRSVDNFGDLGERPSHPELLDYLACQLIDSGWSVKAVIREIVLSDTFRQSSAASADGKNKDPENRLFHRYVSRRLEAEAIRDLMLSVSGRLDPTMFGPSVDPYRPEDVDRRKLYAGPLDGEGRRSLYLKVTRMGPAKLLQLFNFPDPSVTRGRRDRTNVPAQALGLMNHPFVHQQADVHAQRLVTDAGVDDSFDVLLEKLFLNVFSRQPSDVELRQYADFFDELAAADGLESRDEALKSAAVWKHLIHTLYNLKEFTYVL